MNDEAGISSTLINLAVALFSQGRYEEEKPLWREAIEISRRINQPRNLAGALGNLGTIYMKEGKYEEALDLFMQGLETHRNTGYRYGMSIALDNVGTAQFHLGNEREALYYLRQSIREARDIKADFVALDALVCLAGIQARNGEIEKALELWGMIRQHPPVAAGWVLLHASPLLAALTLVPTPASPQASRGASRRPRPCHEEAREDCEDREGRDPHRRRRSGASGASSSASVYRRPRAAGVRTRRAAARVCGGVAGEYAFP